MKTVVFCLPGSSFSNRSLECWTRLFLTCPNWGIHAVLSSATGAYMYHVRNLCLGGQRHGPKTQKPFSHQLNYHYLFWIDNDVIYTPQHFKILFDYLENHSSISILSGTYPGDLEMNTVTAIYQNQRLKTQELIKHTLPFQVDTCALGFCLVRHGVFEALEFPWFEPLIVTDPQNQIRSFSGEDVAFCHKARQAGFDSHLHPQVLIGHEKTLILK